MMIEDNDFYSFNSFFDQFNCERYYDKNIENNKLYLNYKNFSEGLKFLL